MDKPKRVLLKLSGELLRGESAGVDATIAGNFAQEVAALRKEGIDVVIVVGGGNFYRGRSRGDNINEPTAHRMGMLGAVMTAMAFRDVLAANDVPARAFSTIMIPQMIEAFRIEDAQEALERGEVVVVGGGTGLPGFTTDTAAAVVAKDLACEVLLKGTNVDGVYDKDPDEHEDAKRYDELTHGEALEQRLQVMDMTAFAMCREEELPIVVFDVTKQGSVLKATHGETGTRVYAQE